MNLQGTGQLLPAFDEVQDFLRLNRNAFGETPPEHVIHQVQAFVLGGVQDFQILLDRGFLVMSGHELIVGHPKPSRRIQMIDVFVIEEGPRLSDQGIDHMPKVDVLFALTQQPRQAFQALPAIPKLQMVLMNQNVEFQADVLAAHRIQVAFDPQDAIGFDLHPHASGRGRPLEGQWPKRRTFLLKGTGPPGIAARHHLF